MAEASKKQKVTEDVKATGKTLVSTVEKLLREGNIRKIIIKNKAGEVLLQIPVTWGIVGAVLGPWLAVLGALAIVIGECTVTVVRKEEKTLKKTEKK